MIKMHYFKNFTQPCLYCTNIPELLFSLPIHTVGSHYQPKLLQCTPAYSVSAPLSTSQDSRVEALLYVLLKQNSTDLHLHDRIFHLAVGKAGSLGLEMVTLHYVL